MEINKIIDLSNDGLNMVVDNDYLYVRCMRDMYKYDLNNMNLICKKTIFNKDGKARFFSIGNDIYLLDFCDFYIIDKNNLNILHKFHFGEDLSSDLCTVRCNNEKIYISMRNGKIIVVDIKSKESQKYEICDVSSWDHVVNSNNIYMGLINGSLIKIDTLTMKIIDNIDICKKNIYSVVYYDNMIYIVSQDTSINIIDATKFKLVKTVKKAVRGMAKIVGIYKDFLVIADRGISIWNRFDLTLIEKIVLPTGHFNKGVTLYNNIIIGSDFKGIYKYKL